MAGGAHKLLDVGLAAAAVAAYGAFIYVGVVSRNAEAEPVNVAIATAAPVETANARVIDVTPPDVAPPVEFIVKFSGDRGTRLRDLLLEDRARAREAFAEFARSRPAFQDFELKLVSFSGECTLVYTGDMPDDPEERVERQRDIAERLRALEDVVNAEPNLIATIGTENN